MYVQYLGVASSAGSRLYTFRVMESPREPREFTLKIQAEEFRPGRLKFQDGPGICMARLQRELLAETPELRAEASLGVEDQDVREYLAKHYSEPKPFKRPGGRDSGFGARE